MKKSKSNFDLDFFTGAEGLTNPTRASFVYDRVHVLSQINGDRAVITYKGSVVAAVRAGDLIKV